ncbi:hypothetical protein [Micromonospora peucetia]|uniref:Uncharacterized protein n=1 Tax=Micromonospora peucetia TaxID=47871 RepID=A0A1C6TV38_9ACTN|nr:hypothetical protein [Micromonospora peucetia]SCL45680.1 hypothetical protein GA0070608_0061 [Micromonospora peucetia]
MAKQPQADSRPYLLSVRASIILALSALVGSATAGLTIASGGGWASALLTGGAATGGAIALFNQIIGDDGGVR